VLYWLFCNEFSQTLYKYPRGITKVVKTSMSLACLDVAADMGLEGSAVVDRKLEVLELPDECVVELPDEGPVVDEFGVGSAVVERKLEVLELPDELELVELPAECAVVVVAVVVDEFSMVESPRKAIVLG